MQHTEEIEPFRLSTGGLFYQLLTSLNIQDQEGYSVRRRLIFLVVICWLPLVILAGMEGNLINASLDISFLYDPKPYVRYLIVIPLLLIADSIVDPLIASNIQSISTSGILGENNQENYNKAIEQFDKKKNSVLADVVILILGIGSVALVLLNIQDMDISTDFTNWILEHHGNKTEITNAGWYFLLVSSPILQIVLFRWLWRFYLWARFLFQVSRMDLNLQATHPDRTGGLGILKNGESAFTLIFLAFGALLSASMAVEIMLTDFTLKDATQVALLYILIALFVMTLPLLFFTRSLVVTKRKGRVTYGGLGYRLSRAFDRKWGNIQDQTRGDELLKTADASAVCDYSDVYEVVRDMRYLPISLKGYVTQIVILAIPFLPLIFTEIPVQDVVNRILTALI